MLEQLTEFLSHFGVHTFFLVVILAGLEAVLSADADVADLYRNLGDPVLAS
jgi:hypothetical protein